MRAFPWILAATSTTVLLAPACVLSEHEDGIAITVSLAHRAAAPGAWPEGVTLEAALVSVTGVEILPCDGASAAATWRALLAEPIAHAHSAGSPTRLGVPAVVDLLAADPAPEELGVLHAPPARYCGVRVTVGPADDDALGLAADPTMLGKSARLAGSLDSTCDRELQVDATLAAPVEVGEDAHEATLVLTLDAATLLAGVDPALPADAACTAALNAARSIH